MKTSAALCETSRNLQTEARLLRETAAEIRRRAAELRARAAAVRAGHIEREFRPTPLHVLLEEPEDSGLEELEDALGVPWKAASRVADAFADAIHRAQKGEIAAGYHILARAAHRDYTCCSPGIEWHRRLLSLWEKALDSYYALYGVRC